MNERPRLGVRAWLFGAAIALVLSALIGGAARYAGGDWEVFCAVFFSSAVTHFGAWMRQHPVESIVFDSDRKDEEETKR